MKLFPYAHATQPIWRMAAELALAQLRAQMQNPDYANAPQLGVIYITDHYASQAQAILEVFVKELPNVGSWTGTVGVGIASNNVEYFDMMEEKFDTMISKLSDSNDTQSKLLMYSRV